MNPSAATRLALSRMPHLAVISAVLCLYARSVAGADPAAYFCMGYPVDGGYPFATVHVSSNVQTDPDAPFRLTIKVIVDDAYIVWPDEIYLVKDDRKIRLNFTGRQDKAGNIVLTVDGVSVGEDRQLLLRFFVDGEPRDVTAGLVVKQF